MLVLESSKLFAGLSTDDMDELRRVAQIRTYAAGENVFKEGDQGDGFFLVRDGLVQVSAVVGHGERRILGRIGTGDFFGEMAVLDNEPRSATVTAELPTTVYFIPKWELVKLLESSPRLAMNLVREFSQRLREFNRQYMKEVLQAERLALVGRFARSIVHDFKNPLNVIGIAAELAGMQNATLEMRQSAKHRIRKQVDRLSNMINELLEFTRGSQSAVVHAQTNYASFVQQLLEEIRVEIADKKVVIECQNQPPSELMLFDPQRLTHVYFNLINNACDAMPDGGKVMVRFSKTDAELLTEIEDTGKGIAPEIAPRLFEAFATYGKAQGTGLGLSICKRIIEDHRGRISARSEPGRGAVFSFYLPLQR